MITCWEIVLTALWCGFLRQMVTQMLFFWPQNCAEVVLVEANGFAIEVNAVPGNDAKSGFEIVAATVLEFTSRFAHQLPCGS